MPQNRPSSPMDTPLCLTVQSDPLAVRAVLSDLIKGLADGGVPATALGSVELVLAEVLNNVVEHAYAHGTGPIEISVTLADGHLNCRVCDQGRGMPQNTLPKAGGFAVDGPIEDLPEGGFGWTLIHKLADDVAYTRVQNTNRLTFRIPLTATGS